MNHLIGTHIEEQGIGGLNYHVFELDRESLRQLGLLLEQQASHDGSIDFRIGSTRLRFTITDGSLLTARYGEAGSVVVLGGRNDLLVLARRILQLAAAQPSTDYLPHVHLDNYFSSAPEGFSDIVIQHAVCPPEEVIPE